jgi:hypothetical protein
MRTLEGALTWRIKELILSSLLPKSPPTETQSQYLPGEKIRGRKTFDEMTELPSSETSGWVRELEGPQEVGGLLEVRSNGKDLVDQILHADNAVLAQVGLDDRVVSESNALLVDLSVSALVDELADGLEVGVTVGDPWLDDLEHLEGGLGQADENTVVDLEKTEELEDLAGLWCNLVDTVKFSLGLVLARGMMDEIAYPLIRTTKTSLSSAGT